MSAELTVLIVSYNTRALTLKALETLHATTRTTRFHTIVVDNASTDGSAEAIAAAFPQVELVASPENLGFARANNLAAARALRGLVHLYRASLREHSIFSRKSDSSTGIKIWVMNQAQKSAEKAVSLFVVRNTSS